MIPIDYARRKARAGKGVIPPNNTQWDNEHHALDVRQHMGIGDSDPLPDLVELFAKLLPQVTVIPHGDLPAAAVFIDHLRAAGRPSWSGLALPMEDGCVWVVYNDSHPVTRFRATLMEEFFHIYLEHPTSTVRLLSNPDSPSRSYHVGVERQAYGCAAALLVPYCGLNKMVAAGATSRQIAAHFQVSQQLVAFRFKVTKLYAKARPWRRK